jgi:hypothetical protein
VVAAPTTPSSAHNIHAGKKAPNSSNEGAPMLDLAMMVAFRGVACTRVLESCFTVSVHESREVAVITKWNFGEDGPH